MSPLETNGNPVRILLVEDDPGDARLTSEAFKKIDHPNQVTVVGDGEKALDYLLQKGAYAQAPLPDLVVLDLNLPRVNGHEVLKEIKNDPRLKRIPVVVLSSSSSEEDIQRAYNGHANCYVTKPVGWSQYSSAIQSISDFWFQYVKLSSQS